MNDLYHAINEDEILVQKEYVGEIIENLDFSKIDLEEVAFKGCTFASCDLAGCAFKQVQFEQCDFMNCTWKNGYFRDVLFLECKCDGNDFSHSSLTRTTFNMGSYHYANFSVTHWEDSGITNSEFGDAFFSEAKFKRIILDQVNLTRADFFKTILKGVDLSTCLIDGISVSDTFRELRGVKINAEQAVVMAQMLGVKFV